MAPGGLALLCSNEVLPTNADGVMGFKQNSDLFYLCGIDQEDTILFIYPDHVQKQNREVLFIRETNEHLKTWEGEKLTKDEAREISGIETVFWTDQFDTFLKRNAAEASFLYLNNNEHDGRNKNFTAKSDQFNEQIKKEFSLFTIQRLAPILSSLRMIKEPEEITQIKEALKITRKGFERLADKMKPEIAEYELEAHLTHEFLINRSRGHAFPPIMASGKNACVLHYITNNEVCTDGDLILMDFGAEYANYNADITRCLPVNGTFNNRQKEVYQAVLNVFHFAKKRMVKGNTLEGLRRETVQKMTEELTKLGLLKVNSEEDPAAFRKYFPHSVSHHLGLDVHDVGSRHEPFKPGMVLTCEPGIYIQEEGLGIRLENDILITEKGNIDLCEDIPLEIVDIEKMMNS